MKPIELIELLNQKKEAFQKREDAPKDASPTLDAVAQRIDAFLAEALKDSELMFTVDKIREDYQTIHLKLKDYEGKIEFPSIIVDGLRLKSNMLRLALKGSTRGGEYVNPSDDRALQAALEQLVKASVEGGR